MQETIKNKYLPEVLEKIRDYASFKDPAMLKMFPASVNEYYPMTEKWLSL